MNAHGFSFLEVCLGAFLAMLIALTCLQSTRQQTQSLSELRRRSRHQEVEERLDLLLHAMLMRALALPSLPGVGASKDNTQLSLRELGLNRMYHFKQAGKVWCREELDPLGSPFAEAPPEENTFVLLTLDGACDIKLELEATGQHSLCEGASFTSREPVLLDFQFSNDCLSLPHSGSWLALLETQAAYTLRLDAKGLLRRESLINQGNQAIAGPLNNFSAEVLNAEPQTQLQILYSGESRREKKEIRALLPSSNHTFLDLVL